MRVFYNIDLWKKKQAFAQKHKLVKLCWDCVEYFNTNKNEFANLFQKDENSDIQMVKEFLLYLPFLKESGMVLSYSQEKFSVAYTTMSETTSVLSQGLLECLKFVFNFLPVKNLKLSRAEMDDNLHLFINTQKKLEKLELECVIITSEQLINFDLPNLTSFSFWPHVKSPAKAVPVYIVNKVKSLMLNVLRGNISIHASEAEEIKISESEISELVAPKVKNLKVTRCPGQNCFFENLFFIHTSEAEYIEISESAITKLIAPKVKNLKINFCPSLTSVTIPKNAKIDIVGATNLEIKYLT